MSQKSASKTTADVKTIIVQNTITGSGPFSPLVPKKSYVSYILALLSILLFDWSMSFPWLSFSGSSLVDWSSNGRQG